MSATPARLRRGRDWYAASAPTVDNDTTQGQHVTDTWTTTSGKVYTCYDDTAGAAQWVETDGTGGGGGGGTPASTVVAERVLDHSASVVGTSTDYARADHSHGTPAMPSASDVGAAPTTRTISTTSPLNGGGDLSADRTLTVDDATTSAKGVVKLAGDLGGTAALPRVVGITESGGAHLPFGAISTGQLLKYDGANVLGTTLSGATAGATIYDQDALASGVTTVSPSQEFCTAQSLGSWANYDLGSVGVSSSIDAHGLKLVCPGPTTGNKLSGVSHATFPAGDWQLLARIDFASTSGNYSVAGIALIQGIGSTEDLYFAGLRGSQGGSSGWISTWSAYNAFSADIVFSLHSVQNGPFWIYIRYGTSGAKTTVWMGASPDGLELVQTDRAIGYTPARIAIVGQGATGTTANAVLHVPYLRVVADTYPGATATPPNRINGALLVGL
jgi:hypothetical protein